MNFRFYRQVRLIQIFGFPKFELEIGSTVDPTVCCFLIFFFSSFSGGVNRRWRQEMRDERLVPFLLSLLDCSSIAILSFLLSLRALSHLYKRENPPTVSLASAFQKCERPASNYSHFSLISSFSVLLLPCTKRKKKKKEHRKKLRNDALWAEAYLRLKLRGSEDHNESYLSLKFGGSSKHYSLSFQAF